LVLLTLSVLLILYIFCLPAQVFKDPTCMVLNDQSGNLLGARIAADGQWRFPYQAEVPDKFIQAITTFEDRRFYYHPGIDPVGIGRAILQNIRQQKIVSGGSTLTMQVIRLSRKGKPRTLYQKIIEFILATRLELRYSKTEILALYASNAPFGGNVVGLETASWRYYGKKPALLTWSEIATLAVLPNSPALIHPGRNRKALVEKRNRLLKKLQEKGVITSMTWELAKEEGIPDKPLPLPRLTPHLLDRAYQEYFATSKNKRTRIKTTIDINLQSQVNRLVSKRHDVLAGNDIHNLAALVLEVETGKVLAYVGNVTGTGPTDGGQVDVIKAPRSTGSILKPFLYAGLLQEGQIIPSSLISDVPTQMNGYQPKNFYESYDGVVTAKSALIRSLNLPFIQMLQDFGLEKFHFLLKKLGLTTLHQPAKYYGLPLILGGAEGSLWDITNAYVGMARTLNHFNQYDGQYLATDFRPPTYNDADLPKPVYLNQAPILNAASIYYTFEAMQKVERPNAAGNWEQFKSSQKIAWKTGTSIGFRDGWAIGLTPKYAVGIWAGNADGEGRPGLVGIHTAAPLLFDVFDHLPASDWFSPPHDELERISICKNSGYRALEICNAENRSVPATAKQLAACPFHQLLHLDKTAHWQVTSDCYAPKDMLHSSWFVLPPKAAYYYRFRNPTYQVVPPFREDCAPVFGKNKQAMEMIYPKENTKIRVPIDLDGQASRTVFKVAHRNQAATIYWHLDNTYLGNTTTFHQKALHPSAGPHILTLVDEQGNRLEQTFEIVN